ncbi:hypothetical protein [Soonwooa purpurea]
MDSRKYFYGKLNNDEYQNIKLQLELELKTKFPEEKSIFINFEQAAANCSLLKGNKKYLQSYHNMSVNISNRISKENNAIDFFIYDNNTFLKTYVLKNVNYKQDSGFFAKNIFTEKDNCEAFFILKTDGNFLICYGTDSFSYASNFLKQK